MSKWHYDNYDNLEIKVIDNFLNIQDVLKINESLIGNEFAWFYNKNVVSENDGDDLDCYQFVHNFINHYTKLESNRVIQDKDCISPRMHLIHPILKKLKTNENIDSGEHDHYNKILRIKANLQPRTEVSKDRSLHTDFDFVDRDVRYMTAIYYVNSNNGKTVFEDIGEVESVRNRLVLFPGYMRHQGRTCTDQKVRCVINFNFLLTDD